MRNRNVPIVQQHDIDDMIPILINERVIDLISNALDIAEAGKYTISLVIIQYRKQDEHDNSDSEPAGPIMLEIYPNSDYRITDSSANESPDRRITVAKIISITPSPTQTNT